MCAKLEAAPSCGFSHEFLGVEPAPLAQGEKQLLQQRQRPCLQSWHQQPRRQAEARVFFVRFHILGGFGAGCLFLCSAWAIVMLHLQGACRV